MKTFLKKIPGSIITVITLVLAVWLLQKLNILPSFKTMFSSKPVIIEDTPLLIKEIKSIAELNTATFYQEIVIDSTMPSLLPVNALKKRIVLIAKGKVTAGIDFNKLLSEDVFTLKDSVSILLPSPRITDVELNPSGIETFYENGRWSGDEVTAVKLKARQRLLNAAGESKILETAAIKGRKVMEEFLRAAGFTKIHFR